MYRKLKRYKFKEGGKRNEYLKYMKRVHRQDFSFGLGIPKFKDYNPPTKRHLALCKRSHTDYWVNGLLQKICLRCGVKLNVH